MSRDLNYVMVIGRLVRDPEIKYTAGGLAVVKFSLANNDSFAQNNERKDYVHYFDVTVWGNQAVNCEKYLKKGSQVAVSGSLRQSRWNDKATGQTRSKVEIIASSVQFLSSALKKEAQTAVPESKGKSMPVSDPWMNSAPTDEVPPWEDESGPPDDSGFSPDNDKFF